MLVKIDEYFRKCATLSNLLISSVISRFFVGIMFFRTDLCCNILATPLQVEMTDEMDLQYIKKYSYNYKQKYDFICNKI